MRDRAAEHHQLSHGCRKRWRVLNIPRVSHSRRVDDVFLAVSRRDVRGLDQDRVARSILRPVLSIHFTTAPL